MQDSYLLGRFDDALDVLKAFVGILQDVIKAQKQLKEGFQLNLKPENILTNDHKNFYLTDILFTEITNQYYKAPLNSVNTIVSMQSKEYLMGEETEPSEVRKCACVLYFMCSGRQPFISGPSLGQTKRNIIRDRY